MPEITLVNLLRPHVAHRPALARVALMLMLLALIQLIAWITPVPPGATGVAGYLPLHVLLETVSIVIAIMVFSVGWYAHRQVLSGNVVVLAALFLAVAWLDFFHTVSYTGMPDFITPNGSGDKHLSYWLSARLLAAIALLIVVLRPWQPFKIRGARYLAITGAITLVALIHWTVIHHQDTLPQWFVPGQGLTALKKALEYLCIAINLATMAVLWFRMQNSQAYNAALLFGAAGVMAMSEFYFTLYTTMTGAYNVLGHAYKVLSYLIIYRAVVVEAIETPYRKFLETQNDLATAVDASNTGLWDWNIADKSLYLSPTWKAQIGYRDDELPNSMDTWLGRLHPDDKEPVQLGLGEFVRSATAHNNRYRADYRLRHQDGSYRWILSRGKLQFNVRGQAVRMCGAHIDITEARRAEERFRLAVEASPTAMIMTDGEGRIVLTNAQTSRVFGYSKAELLGQSIQMLVPQSHRARHEQHVRTFTHAESNWRMGRERELFGLHKDGHAVPVEIGLTTLQTGEGHLTLASVIDLQEKLESEQRIKRLAHFDTLTDLPNRLLLKDRVSLAIATARRKGSRISMLFLDLDHFKNVNDTLGHRIGDLLLLEVSKRLRTAMREQDTVSRMGGDEFLIMLPDTDADGAVRIAEMLLSRVVLPCTIEQHELMVTPSIGIAMFPDDGEDFETLYQHADTAMYRAKEDGRNLYRFYTHEMQAHTERLLKLETGLRHALARDQLSLHYQPQLDLASGRVIGVEALLRWEHPELGMVSPAEFIPIAENSGQIVQIGEWVLRTACAQLRSWMDQGLPTMTMAVNLSAVQFRQAGLPELVSQTLQATGLAPQHLELELTESVAMVEPDKAVHLINELYKLGISMSIDDFGTGYSSLSYLRQFRISRLKIDRSFVQDIDASESAIVNTIIRMAQSLGFKTIAEGVETEEQLHYLRQHGCDEIQGYHFSRPLPADQIEAFLRKRTG